MGPVVWVTKDSALSLQLCQIVLFCSNRQIPIGLLTWTMNWRNYSATLPAFVEIRVNAEMPVKVDTCTE